MKNIYRFVLVAVAAMGFVACSMENEPVVENNEKGTVVTVTADLDATRSGFAGMEGNVFKSQWDGNEKFHYYDTEFGSSNYATNEYGSAGSKASVTIELSGTSSNGGTLRFCTPSTSAMADATGFNCFVPTTQTPLADSCDPAAHILTAEYSYEGAIPAAITAEFQHYAAYGRMTLKNMELHDSVELDGEENYIGKVLVSIDSKQYTLNAENIVADESGNYVFWFACDAAAPTTMSVVVFDKAGCTYTKTLNLEGRNFSFEQGKVTKFNVNMADATYVNNEEDNTVTAATILTDFDYGELYSGRYTFYNADGDEVVIYLNADDAPNHNAIKSGDYALSETTSPASGYFRINRLTIDGVQYMGEVLNLAEATMNVSLDANGNYVVTFEIVIGYGGDYAIRFDIAYTEINDELVPYTEQLATPTNLAYSIDGTSATITWDAVENADKYYVWCNNGIEAQTVTETTATFTGLTEGQSYVVTVRAQPADGSTSYRESDASENVEFTVPYGSAEQLAMPVITATATADTATVSWEAVTNASGYSVTLGDQSQTVAAGVTSAEFTGLTPETEYDVTVVAKGDGTQYTDSAAATTTVTTEAEQSGGNTGGPVDMTGCSVVISEFSSYGQPVLVSTTAGGKTITFRQRLQSSARDYTVTTATDITDDLYGIWSVTIDGVAATSASGTVTVTKGGMPWAPTWGYSFNMVVDGITYTGTAGSVTIQ